LIAKYISKSPISKLAEITPSDKFIYSSKIREYVTEELKQRNQNTIAESYAGYSKNNVISIKEEQLKNNKYDSKVSQTKNTQSKQFTKDKDNTSRGGTKTGLQ
jgi:transcriptional repressor NrdR